MQTTQVRERERARVLGDEQEQAIRFAAGFAMIGLLVGLSAFFLTFAPGV